MLGIDEGAHLVEALGLRAPAPHAGHDEGVLLVVQVDADVAAREAHEDGAVLLGPAVMSCRDSQVSTRSKVRAGWALMGSLASYPGGM